MSDAPEVVTYVHWRDATMNYGVDEKREDVKLVDLWELGFLFHEDDESITLTLERDKCMDKTRIRLTIPKVNIQERYDVALKDFLRWAKRKNNG